MKKLSIFIIAIAALSACKKEYRSVYSYPDKANKAKVKFVHTVVNSYPLPDTAAQAGFQLYVNGAKITGATNLTYGGGVFPGVEYTMLPAGNNTLKAVIPAGSKNQEIAAFESPLKLEDQKTYTAFIVDSLPNASLLLVDENFAGTADSGKYFVRLVNLMYNTPDGVDLYSTPEATKLDSMITYKGVGEFKQSFVGTGARSFSIRNHTTNGSIVSVSITPVQGRMYTIIAYGMVGKGGTRAPKGTFYTSRFQTYEF